jgi:hypothetical protein
VLSRCNHECSTAATASHGAGTTARYWKEGTYTKEKEKTYCFTAMLNNPQLQQQIAQAQAMQMQMLQNNPQMQQKLAQAQAMQMQAIQNMQQNQMQQTSYP